METPRREEREGLAVWSLAQEGTGPVWGGLAFRVGIAGRRQWSSSS